MQCELVTESGFVAHGACLWRLHRLSLGRGPGPGLCHGRAPCRDYDGEPAIELLADHSGHIYLPLRVGCRAIGYGYGWALFECENGCHPVYQPALASETSPAWNGRRVYLSTGFSRVRASLRASGSYPPGRVWFANDCVRFSSCVNAISRALFLSDSVHASAWFGSGSALVLGSWTARLVYGGPRSRGCGSCPFVYLRPCLAPLTRFDWADGHLVPQSLSYRDVSVSRHEQSSFQIHAEAGQ